MIDPSLGSRDRLENLGCATVSFTERLLCAGWVFREEDKHIKEYISNATIYPSLTMSENDEFLLCTEKTTFI